MPYAPDIPGGKTPPDNVPAGKRAQWSAIWNATFDKTGDEGKAFAAANAILKEVTMEEKQEAVLYRQDDVSYSVLSPQIPDQACINCRWFENSEGCGECEIVEGYPEDIAASGWCNKWESRQDAISAQTQGASPVPVMVMEPGDMMEMAYVDLQQPPAEGAMNKLLRRKTDSVTLSKDAEGRRIALIIGSNGYQDRDEEHVSVSALADYEKSCWQGDEYVGRNKCLFWHKKWLDIGDIIYAKMVNGFLVEIARERPAPLARKVWDYLETNPDGIEWGASIGFIPLEMEDNIFKRLKKVETSILPREAASNVLTYTEVTNMSKADEVLARVFGDVPDAAKLLREGKFAELNSKLAAAGHEEKAADEDPAPDDTGTAKAADDLTPMVEKLSAVVVELIEAQGSIDERIEAAESAQKEREKAVSDYGEQVQSVLNDLAEIKAILTDTPRASKSDKTAITDQTKIAALEKEVAGEPKTSKIFGSLVNMDEVEAAREARRNGR